MYIYTHMNIHIHTHINTHIIHILGTIWTTKLLLPLSFWHTSQAGGSGGKSSEEMVLELSVDQESGLPSGSAHGQGLRLTNGEAPYVNMARSIGLPEQFCPPSGSVFCFAFSRFLSGSRVGIRLEHVWFWSFWTSLSSICWCWRLYHITSPIVRWMMWTIRILTYIYHARNPIFIDDFPTFSHNVPHSFPIICNI